MGDAWLVPGNGHGMHSYRALSVRVLINSIFLLGQSITHRMENVGLIFASLTHTYSRQEKILAKTNE